MHTRVLLNDALRRDCGDLSLVWGRRKGKSKHPVGYVARLVCEGCEGWFVPYTERRGKGCGGCVPYHVFRETTEAFANIRGKRRGSVGWGFSRNERVCDLDL